VNSSLLIPSINLESALLLVKAALKAASKLKISVSVAVAGTELQTIALVRGDYAPPHSLETAKRKAQTAASRGQESGLLPEPVALALPLAANNLLTNLRGGLPILIDGVCLGGSGIGGGSSEQDVAVAQAALEFFIQQLK
jgi:glc operon protein GlcG